MRSNIEARIQEVVEFISEGTNESLGLVILRRMMLDLGVRHGAYGSTIVSSHSHVSSHFPTGFTHCKAC